MAVFAPRLVFWVDVGAKMVVFAPAPDIIKGFRLGRNLVAGVGKTVYL
jgi:hypothetical protein